MTVFKNNLSGDVLELPPPDFMGNGVVLLNGKIVERCLYSDAANSVTTGDGTEFTSDEWALHVIRCFEMGKWVLNAEG